MLRHTLHNKCCIRFLFLIGPTRDLQQKIVSCRGAHYTTYFHDRLLSSLRLSLQCINKVPTLDLAFTCLFLPVQGLQEEVASLHAQVAYVKDFTDSLITDAVDGADVTLVTTDLDNLVVRYDMLKSEVDGVLCEIEAGSENIASLQVGIIIEEKCISRRGHLHSMLRFQARLYSYKP